MDLWIYVTGLAVIIGIIAGIVQVLQYFEQRRAQKITEPPPQSSLTLRPTIPHNLPPRGEFIGRENEKERVRSALASRWPLTCIDGIGGVGKTALALEVAHECLRASGYETPPESGPIFSGFVWVSAKDRELALNDILDTIARTLDRPGLTQQPHQEKLDSVCKLLQRQHYLLIVDNYETVTDDAVRAFLLGLPEPSKALITSREQKLRQTVAVSLKGMEQSEALMLIRREGQRLGLRPVERSENETLLLLYQATGGMPLAIKWAIGQIKQKGQSLDAVLAALHDARGDIFREIFERSWRLLTTEAQRILLVTPVFAASASKAAIEAASDIHHYVLDEHLGQLVEMCLIDASGELDESKLRYNIHPLTRAFATAKLKRQVSYETEARLGAARYFVNYIRERDGSERKWYLYDEFAPERENVMSLMQWCYEQGLERKNRELLKMVVECSQSLDTFLYARGHWNDCIVLCQWAIEASKELGDWRTLGLQAFFIANVYYWRGEVDMAEQWACECSLAMNRTGDPANIAVSEHISGIVAYGRQDYETAKRLLLQALKETTQITGPLGIAAIKTWLSIVVGKLERWSEARQWLDQARSADKEVGDLEGYAITTGYLADVARMSGRWEEARQLYMEALMTVSRVGRLSTTARCKWGLALVLQQQEQNVEQVLEYAKDANSIYQQLGMKCEAEETEVLILQLLKANPPTASV